MQAVQELSRSQRLKAGTKEVHQNVDDSIMAHDPFSSIENYLQFLSLQYFFLRDFNGLYQHKELATHLDDLAGRSRLNLLCEDFIDLNAPAPEFTFEASQCQTLDFASALGWLYVIEGSKVGAAMLGRFASKLGLTGEQGARYLAGPGAGRGSSWRELVNLLDTVELSDAQETAMIQGARAAFLRFQHIQAHVYPQPA